MPDVSIPSGTSFNLNIPFANSEYQLVQQLLQPLVIASETGKEVFTLFPPDPPGDPQAAAPESNLDRWVLNFFPHGGWHHQPAPPVPPGDVGAFAIVETGQAITSPVHVPTGYTYTIIDTDHRIDVIGNGGHGDITLMSSTVGVDFYTGGGSGTVVAGAGNNVISTPLFGGGDYLIVSGDGNDTINALSGNDTISPGGGANRVELGSGNDSVSLSGTNDTVNAAFGSDTISVTGNDSVLLTDRFAKLQFINGSAPSTVIGGLGSVTVDGGAGGGFFEGGLAGHNSIAGGAGQATIFGGGPDDTLAAGGSLGDHLIAGAGNETLTSANSQGLDSLYGGTGHDLMIAGLGGDLMVGGAGTMNFEFINGLTNPAKSYTVLNYHPGDTVTLQDYGATPITSISSASGNTTLNLSDGTKITFVGVANANNLNIHT